MQENPIDSSSDASPTPNKNERTSIDSSLSKASQEGRLNLILALNNFIKNLRGKYEHLSQSFKKNIESFVKKSIKAIELETNKETNKEKEKDSRKAIEEELKMAAKKKETNLKPIDKDEIRADVNKSQPKNYKLVPFHEYLKNKTRNNCDNSVIIDIDILYFDASSKEFTINEILKNKNKSISPIFEIYLSKLDKLARIQGKKLTFYGVTCLPRNYLVRISNETKSINFEDAVDNFIKRNFKTLKFKKIYYSRGVNISKINSPMVSESVKSRTLTSLFNDKNKNIICAITTTNGSRVKDYRLWMSKNIPIIIYKNEKFITPGVYMKISNESESRK